MTNQAYQDMLHILQQAGRLLISGHKDPDCDSIGSVLGLWHALDGKKRGWIPAYQGKVPDNLTFLPGTEAMRPIADIRADEFDAVLLLDSSEPARAGELLPALAAGKPLYSIDHHATGIGDETGRIVEADAAATGEIIAALLEEADIPPTAEVALCLYAAIADDTGGFRYTNTCPRCFQQAARMLPLINVEEIRIRLFEDRTLAHMKMLAACMNHVTLECDGRLAWSVLPKEEMARWGATDEDCHNIVNQLLVIKGVEVGFLAEEYDGFIKASFRSRKCRRIDGLAKSLGGGGHEQAAGCRREGTLADNIPEMVRQAKLLFEA